MSDALPVDLCVGAATLSFRRRRARLVSARAIRDAIETFTTCTRPLVALDCAFWGSFDDSSYQPHRKRQNRCTDLSA